MDTRISLEFQTTLSRQNGPQIAAVNEVFDVLMCAHKSKWIISDKSAQRARLRRVMRLPGKLGNTLHFSIEIS